MFTTTGGVNRRDSGGLGGYVRGQRHGTGNHRFIGQPSFQSMSSLSELLLLLLLLSWLLVVVVVFSHY